MIVAAPYSFLVKCWAVRGGCKINTTANSQAGNYIYYKRSFLVEIW